MKEDKSNHFRFESLLVYQKALDYIDFSYALSAKFPQVEIYELGRQYRRAAQSVALNIGEGESGTDREFVKFLRYSQRSASECLVCTTVALRRKYISEEESRKSRALLAELARMLTSLSAVVKKRC